MAWNGMEHMEQGVEGVKGDGGTWGSISISTQTFGTR
jgi:hypothetical protein